MQNNSIYEIFSPNPCSSIRIRIFVYGANKCVRVSICVCAWGMPSRELHIQLIRNSGSRTWPRFIVSLTINKGGPGFGPPAMEYLTPFQPAI